MNAARLGRKGEDIASDFYTSHGYTIIARNYRWAGGEVDIIAVDGDELVFSEVKMWRSYEVNEIERSVNFKKRRRIINASRKFLAANRMYEYFGVRFDVIFIDGTTSKIRHLPGAFTETDIL